MGAHPCMRAWLRFGDGRRHAFTSPNEFGHAHVHATASGAETLLRFREGADVDTHSIASRPYLARPTASHIVFMYLGRRGLGRYTLELAQAVRSLPSMRPTFVVSEQNEIIENIAHSARDIVKLPTFAHAASAAPAINFRRARDTLFGFLEHSRPCSVVNLMPHVWTPLLRPGIQRLGARFVTVIHDARGHPGDVTGCATRWINSEAQHADAVVTLSDDVAEKLVAQKLVPHTRIRSLFHPDLTYGSVPSVRNRRPGAPLRLLFFGRIKKYKGLHLLAQAVELLRAEGLRVDLGVAGAGNIGGERRRLEALGAQIFNRWLSDAEIPSLLRRYDAVALPYTEASQSGVVATAYGNLVPVIATPVGGLREQVICGKTGLLTRAVTARALADAIRRLAEDPVLHRGLSAHLAATRETRSMQRFVQAIVEGI
jgi:glycosyltransferase involved in cell wall biosynthesis